FVVCAFADYLDDLPRHLFAFHAMFDLILIVDSAWLAQVAWARFHAREHVRFDRINVASREGVEEGSSGCPLRFLPLKPRLRPIRRRKSAPTGWPTRPPRPRGS